MATTSQQNASKVLTLLCIFMLGCPAMATQFRVSGPRGWSTPKDPDEYNRWAERIRFQIGDSLLFEYPEGKDSVLQVHEEDFDACNTESPIARFDDGNTVFMFNRSGPFFFISGDRQNCLNNEKLFVVVMADRASKSPGTTNEPGSPPPEGSIEFVPTPPYTPNAAATMKVAAVASTVGAILGTIHLFSI